MFVTRLISGIILLIMAIAAMWLGGPVLALILLLISMVGFFELNRALLKKEETDKHMNAPTIVGMVGVVAYYVLMFIWPSAETLFLVIAMVLMAELFCYVFLFPKYQCEEVIFAVFAFLYAPVMLSCTYMTREIDSEMGFYMVWLILISAWGCDTCAYCVGKLIGKKKIFPILSPHKSLEGCIGGCLGSALIGVAYGFLVVEKAFPGQKIAWLIGIICAFGALMSMVGDLAASAIKRNHNIKDYGHLIPGHGGVMDRFDSMIVTAPMVYVLTALLIMK